MLHVLAPLLIRKESAGGLAGADCGRPGPLGEKVEDGVLKLQVDRIALLSAAAGGAVFHLVPAFFPFLSPADGAAAVLAGLFFDHGMVG